MFSNSFKRTKVARSVPKKMKPHLDPEELRYEEKITVATGMSVPLVKTRTTDSS